MEFGCAYARNPSPGYCVKDVRSKVVDKQCEVKEGTCKLIGAVAPLQNPIQSQIQQPQTPQMQTIKNLPPLSPRKNTPIKHNAKISGPISAYATKLTGKSFNFFGDAHFSMMGTCKPCKDIKIPSLQMNIPENSADCDDISVLLSEVFSKASVEKKWIDFYIEIPFLSTNKFRPSDRDVASGIDSFGYLYKLYYIFYNCLNKTNCKYDTTRFHYVDIRLEYRQSDLKGLTEEMKQIIAMTGQKLPPSYGSTFIIYESYISTIRVENCVDKFAEMVMNNDRKRNSYIEETDKLMRDLYFSGGQTMTGKIEPKNFRLFKLYLTSDNFLKDATDLIDLSSVRDGKELLELRDQLAPPTMMVNRKGKNMHRIRSQLLSLEEEGKGELVNNIVNFIVEQYIKNVNNSSIIDLWRSLMIAYDGYINAKYRAIDDVHFLIDKLSQEFRKLMQITSVTISGVSLLMDAYTLARIFRSYPGKDHVDSVKSIVYAGDAHISTYVKFFESVLGVDFKKYNPNNKNLKNYESLSRCLSVDMSDFKDF